MEILNVLTFEFEWFGWVVLPILIFLARIVDVTLGTLRIIFVSKGLRTLAPLIGFFEALIWLVAIGQIMQSLTNPVLYLAYAAGFAAGNYIGIYLEEKLAIGLLCVRIITNDDATGLIDYLKKSQFGVTSVSASGVSGQVQLILSIIHRKDMARMSKIVKEFSPRAFLSVEDVRSVQEGFLPSQRTGFMMRPWILRK